MLKRHGTARMCIGFGLAAAFSLSAPASSQNLDLGITDDASYAAAIEAISASEFVRYDYRNNPRPRIAAVVAGLMEFATRNPLADEGQLILFAQMYGSTLLAAAPGDPDLRRSANFLPALRYKLPLTSVKALRGLNTDIGAGTAARLGITVPDPLDFSSLQTRIVGFEAARGLSFTNSAEFGSLLVGGLLGRDVEGNARPALATVLRLFLESEGYEPLPDGVDDERFAPVYDGLSQLPATYADYMTAITVPAGMELPPIWTSVSAQFATIAACTDAQLAEIADADANGPTLLEGVAIGNGPEVLDLLQIDLVRRLDEIVTPRTILNANALLMYQNSDPAVRGLAVNTQSLALAQGQTFDAMAILGASLTIAGGAATVVGGVATIAGGVALATVGSPTGVAIAVGIGIAIAGGAVTVAGAGIFVGGVVQLVDALGQHSDDPSPAEIQMFDQVLAVRQDIENMRTQMDGRFDRIEMQLNFVFAGMANGLNAIGNQIGDLQESVYDLTRDVLINRAALERIEDALYGMAEDLLDLDLAVWSNTYLNYRANQGVDLPYTGSGGAQSFTEGSNAFFTVAVNVAQNNTFAGPTTSMLTPASADELLNGASIGRNVNDLRVFPFNHLGLPRLSLNRIVAPAPWAQGAAAYVRFARANPWYFAYQYEQQILAGGTTPQLNRIIQEGQNLATAMANGRNQNLFDALFTGYNGAAQNLRTAINNQVLAPRGLSSGMTSINPWGPTGQEVRALAPSPPMDRIQSVTGSIFLSLAAPWDPKDFWGLFRSDEAQTAAVLLAAIPEGGGMAQPWGSIRWEAGGSTLRFTYITPEGLTIFERMIVHNRTFTNAHINGIWLCQPETGLRAALLSGSDLTGFTYNTCTSPTTITILSDTIIAYGDTKEGTEEAKVVPPDMTEPTPGFSGQVAMDGDTMVVGNRLHNQLTGIAYIYRRTGVEAWSLEATLNGDGGDGSEFGQSVSISGDTLIVGSPGDSTSASVRGAAYIYTRTGSTWTRQAKLEASTGGGGGIDFGKAVSIDGDTAVVGAPFYNTNVGAAYVFVRSDSTWTQQQRLLRPLGNLAGARFGWSVSIHGESLIVGASDETIGAATRRGAAYVFTRSGTTWSAQGSRLVAAGGAINDTFGFSVSIHGNRAIIGAPGENGGNNHGAAYLFNLPAGGTNWTQMAKVIATNRDNGAFGTSVSMYGEWAVAGAPLAYGPEVSARGDGPPPNAFWGAAYAIPAALTLNASVEPIYASDALYPFRYSFGFAVAISGQTIVGVGLTDANPNQGISGRAAVYVKTIAPAIESLVRPRLDALGLEMLNAIVGALQSGGSNTIKDAAEAVSDWSSLIGAYATFSLPFAMEASNVLRATLGGNPTTGELPMQGGTILPICQGMLAGQIEEGHISDILLERSAISQQEINDAIAAPVQGHAYLNWMLAELRDLGDNAFNLAVDDTYAVLPNMTLSVNAANGLMKNDVLQPCRTTLADTAFVGDMMYVPPENGIVMVNADGSFTYTPNPGFTGSDRFTYRSGTSVAGIGCQPGGVQPRGVLDQHVFSNPATVVILVGSEVVPPPDCPGDANGDGMVAFSDITSVLENWNADYSPGTGPGDANHSGIVNFSDITSVLENWGSACR